MSCTREEARNDAKDYDRLCGDWLVLQAKFERLRNAAAAVVEAWTPENGWDEDSHLAVSEAVEHLRIAAGIKAAPSDETHDPDPDGDRLPENDR